MNAQAEIWFAVNLLLTTLGKVGVRGRPKGDCPQGVTEMSTIWINQSADQHAFGMQAMPADERHEDLLVASCLAAAAQGDTSAYYDLGVAYSTGSHGVHCDLIEAHKWFNLAAVAGHSEAALCRADISDEMTAREISEAQRRAREWLAATSPSRRAA